MMSPQELSWGGDREAMDVVVFVGVGVLGQAR